MKTTQVVLALFLNNVSCIDLKSIKNSYGYDKSEKSLLAEISS